MREPTILKSPNVELVKKEKVDTDPMDWILRNKKVVFLSALLFATSILLGYFEYKAYEFLSFGQDLALACTVLLQICLISSEIFFLKCAHKYKKFFIAVFGIGVALYGLFVMKHDIETKKVTEIAHISDNSKYQTKLTKLEKTVSDYQKEYLKLSNGKPGQAKALKAILGTIRGDLEEHKLTKPEATKQVSLNTDLAHKKAQAQFGLRVILLVASFLFLSALVGNLKSVTQ